MIIFMLSIFALELHKNDAEGIPLHLNENVVVTGVITANFSTNITYQYTKVFLQDSTGGIYIYSQDYYDIHRGDSVTVYGKVSQWKGVTEILLDSFKLLKRGAKEPSPIVVKGEEIVRAYKEDNTEPLEGRLVKVMGVHTNGFGVYERGSGYAFSDSTGQFQVFVNSYSDSQPHPLSGTSIQRRPYNITGVITQVDTSLPYSWNYVLLPRDKEDLEPASSLIPVSGPILYKITDSSVTIRFETFTGSYALVEYGESEPFQKTDKLYSDSIHIFTIYGLKRGVEYRYRCKTFSLSDSFQTPIYRFRTPSDSGNFTFVSMADSRNEWYIPGARVDVYNERFQRNIYLVKERNPGFILFSGDMIVGADTRDTLLWEWRNWLDIMTIVSRTIPLFTAIGNHENGTYNYYNAEDVYRKMFELPENGPSGYNELVYSFDYSFCHIDVLDSDITNNEHRVDKNQREWLKEDLRNTERPVKIATAHETAFKDNRGTGNCLENYPAERDSLWRIFVDEGVMAYLCGHFHHFNKDYYGRNIPEWMRPCRQIVNGSCGAGIYEESTSINKAHYVFWDMERDTGIGYVYDINNNLLDTVHLYSDISLPDVGLSLNAGSGYILVHLKNPVKNNWITYNIQRSINGEGFRDYHLLTGSEIDSGFVDDSVIPGNIYAYRCKIKTLFKEGYSESVSLYYEPEESPVYIYTVQNKLGINLFLEKDEEMNIFVIDSSGRIVTTVHRGSLSKGFHIFRVEKPGDGVFFLKVGKERIRFLILGMKVLGIKQ